LSIGKFINVSGDARNTATIPSAALMQHASDWNAVCSRFGVRRALPDASIVQSSSLVRLGKHDPFCSQHVLEKVHVEHRSLKVRFARSGRPVH
jgi:hypothetical protein